MKSFWNRRGPLNYALLPMGWGYDLAARTRQSLHKSRRTPCPSICVGNATLGGGGKTPMVRMLAAHLRQQGWNPHIISRGFKRKQPGTFQVKPHHNVYDCGDEAILLAADATSPVWVADDRLLAAQLAYNQGADLLILDDGYQNPQLHKDIHVLVTDAGFGFGNGWVFPAGPLRETAKAAIARADLHILLASEGESPLPSLANLPAMPATLQVTDTSRQNLPNGKWLVFAGLARPQKFFATAQKLAQQKNAHIIACKSFPDHYFYNHNDWQNLQNLATKHAAHLITNEKDAARLASQQTQQCHIIKSQVIMDTHVIEDLLATKWPPQ